MSQKPRNPLRHNLIRSSRKTINLGMARCTVIRAMVIGHKGRMMRISTLTRTMQVLPPLHNPKHLRSQRHRKSMRRRLYNLLKWTTETQQRMSDPLPRSQRKMRRSPRMQRKRRLMSMPRKRIKRRQVRRSEMTRRHRRRRRTMMEPRRRLKPNVKKTSTTT